MTETAHSVTRGTFTGASVMGSVAGAVLALLGSIRLILAVLKMFGIINPTFHQRLAHELIISQLWAELQSLTDGTRRSEPPQGVEDIWEARRLARIQVVRQLLEEDEKRKKMGRFGAHKRGGRKVKRLFWRVVYPFLPVARGILWVCGVIADGFYVFFCGFSCFFCNGLVRGGMWQGWQCRRAKRRAKMRAEEPGGLELEGGEVGGEEEGRG